MEIPKRLLDKMKKPPGHFCRFLCFLSFSPLVIGLLAVFISCSHGSPEERPLTIVYANNINGQLDPCG